MAKVVEIEGVGEAFAKKLALAGITTTGDLLEKGASPKGRKEIAEKSGISDSLILQWVNHVDLFRIKGIGSEYSDLLEAAGVDTVPELAQRNPEHLLEKMTAVNLEKKLVRRLPVLSQVKNWVEQAKDLPRIVSY
jgi:predicted flap endonuclease-1-like 5' DNA nuclease